MIEREVRVTLNFRGPARDITLTYPLTAEHERMLTRLHETSGKQPGYLECRMHDDDPALADKRGPDGRIPNTWLYLRRDPRSGLLLLCHWPGGPVRGKHELPYRMSDEHRRRQEYIVARGQAAGHQVETEKTMTGGSTTSDVVLRGSVTMTAEAQPETTTLRTVLRRDAAIAGVGVTPTWFADRKDPQWAFRVAHVETNSRLGLDPHTWPVSTGPRSLERERCTPRSRFRSCPESRRNWCGQWHGFWVPKPGLTVDDVVEQTPAGDLVRLDTGRRQGVILTTPHDRDEWLDTIPEQRTPVREPRRQDSVVHPDYAADLLRKAVAERPAPVSEPESAPTSSHCRRAFPPYVNPPAECPNWGKGPCGGGGLACTRCEPL